MANSLPYIELGKPVDSSNAKWIMSDPKKEPVFDDFGGLIQQAVQDQSVSHYRHLNKKMKLALGIAALKENKTDSIDADFNDINKTLNAVFAYILEDKEAEKFLGEIYKEIISVLIYGYKKKGKYHEGYVDYCIDNALEKEEDKQAFNAKYFSHEDEADYWYDEVAHG